MSIKRRLVLTFDAFGTLFSPKDTIGAQYALVAARHGVSGFTSDQLNSTFRHAFKEGRRQYPNYGKDSHLGPERWWAKVIRGTFQPLHKGRIPNSLVDALLRRFTTSEGYVLYPDVLQFFREVKRQKELMAREDNPTDIVVGIISNSDDRVQSILRSFGISISPQRVSAEPSVFYKSGLNDIDFAVYSYDAGFEKPDHRIFDAAKSCAAVSGGDINVEPVYVHVGDDPVEDCQAAEQAGWKGVCMNGHGRNEDYGPKTGDMLCFSDLSDLADYLWNDGLGSEKSRNKVKPDFALPESSTRQR